MVVTRPSRLAMSVVFWVTCWLVAKSCEPFTASVEAAATVPSVTPVILPVPPALTVTPPKVGASAISRLIAPLTGSVTVRMLPPE